MTRTRKLALTAITAALVLAAVELISFLLLAAVQREWSGLGAIEELRGRALSSSGTAVGPARPEEELPEAVARAQIAYAIHPYLGFVLDSGFNRKQRLKRGGQDSLDFGFGLVEPGLFHPRSPDRPVVAITGGSVAYQFAVAGRETLIAQLSRRVPRMRDAITVNLALAGYKQPQQLIALSYLMSLGAHFDVVLNIDGFNEVALPPSENLPKGVFPFFPRNWYYRIDEARDPSDRIAEGRISFLQSSRTSWAELFSRAPLSMSFTAGLVWTLRDRQLAAAIAEELVQLVERAGERHLGYATTGPPWRDRDPDESYRELASFWMRSSELMKALVEGRGGRYFHVLQPNQHVEGSKPMTAEEKRVALRENSFYGVHAAAAYGHLRSLGRKLARRGVSFSDQVMVFEDVEETLYVDTCCHLNPRGYRLLARSIAEFMAAELEEPSAD